MYQPKKYQKNDKAYFLEFIKQHPFASLVSNGSRLMATHLPFLTAASGEDFRLFSHLANHNEQLPYIKDQAEALIIFQGAHSYISSSWYKEKDISTWDYSAVHVNVTLKLQTRAELEDSLERLVEHFENQEEQPLFYRQIPKEMLRDHLPLITGFWCEPTHIEGIAKLHQGMDKDTVESVLRHLEKRTDPLSHQLKTDIQQEHGL